MTWLVALAHKLAEIASSTPTRIDDEQRALALSTVLYEQQAWQLRKVQSHELREGDYEIVKVSIDCVPQDLPGLAYALDGPGGGREDAILVPVTYMNKGALRQFDMRGPGGEALPIIGRGEYADLMRGVLIYQLEGALLPGADDAALADALDAILDADPAAARAASKRLLQDGTAEGHAVLEPASVREWARELLTSLPDVWVLFALVPREYAGRRVVIKYSHHAKQAAERAPARQRWLGAAGISTLPVSFKLFHPTGAASHHLEVTVPPELSCASLQMPGQIADRNTTDSSDSGVVHGAASYAVEPDSLARVEFSVPWPGMRATAWLVSTVTFAVTFLGQVLPGAQQALIKAADGAGAVLLAVPAVAVAFAVRTRESDVESTLLGPLRLWITICALWLFACACSVVGVLHEPFRTWLWCLGALLALPAALTLCARELRRKVGGPGWWTLTVAVSAAVVFALEARVASSWPASWSTQIVEWVDALCRSVVS